MALGNGEVMNAVVFANIEMREGLGGGKVGPTASVGGGEAAETLAGAMRAKLNTI